MEAGKAGLECSQVKMIMGGGGGGGGTPPNTVKNV